MKRILFLVASLSVICVLAANKPVPSGPLKVYKGPEGELIGMVEVNERKEMLVHFKNIGGALEGSPASTCSRIRDGTGSTSTSRKSAAARPTPFTFCPSATAGGRSTTPTASGRSCR